MRRHGRGLAIGALLALGALLLAVINPVSAEDEDAKTSKMAQKDIFDLAKDIESGKSDGKKAAAIRKKYKELYHLMAGFEPSPRMRGHDGVEIKLNRLGKHLLTKAQLHKERSDLLNMTYLNLAYAEVVHHYAPAKQKGGKGAKDWKRYTEDWKTATKAFLDAIKKSDPAALKTAALNITKSCNSCHSDFRDAN